MRKSLLLPNCLLLVLLSCCSLFCSCHANQTKAPPSSGYSTLLSDRAVCTKLVSRADTALINNAAGVLAVAQCPPDVSDSAITDLCHLPDPERHIRPDTVPVFDNRGILYINQYCLMCNSAPDQALQAVSALTNLTISCSRSVDEPERHFLDQLLQAASNGSFVLPVGCRGTFLATLSHPALVDCCPSNETLCRAKFNGVSAVDIAFNFRIDFFNLSGRSQIPNEKDNANRSTYLWNSSSWTEFSFPRRVTRVSFLVLSILSLLCLIAIYSCCCLPGLRNRPGYLLVSHSLALLLVYTIDLLELTEIPSISLQQQRWLYSLTVFATNAAFCWALLFGCDLLRALSGLRVSGGGGGGGASQPADSRSRLAGAARFALIGWGVPLLFAAAPIVTHRAIWLQQADQQQRNATDVGFTNWRQLQLGIVFAPWAATLALNCLALMAIWRRIFLAVRSARQTGGGFNGATNTRGFTKAKRLAITALKVSVLLGVCWLPFCLSIALGLSFESTGFLAGQLCRSCQGLLLLAAFGSSARVRKQLADRLNTRSTTSGPGSGLAVKDNVAKGRRRNTGATTCGSSNDSRPPDEKSSKRLLKQLEV